MPEHYTMSCGRRTRVRERMAGEPGIHLTEVSGACSIGKREACTVCRGGEFAGFSKRGVVR